jgi:hypothetical protein
MNPRPAWLSAALLSLTLLCVTAPARADDVSGAQRRAAEEYLAALASGSAQTMAYAIHPSELDRLRISVVQQLRQEGAQGGSAKRTRLFGPALPLAEIEKFTSMAFYQGVARRIVLRGRRYESLKGLVAVRDGEQVQVVVKARQPKERGGIELVEVVALLPYGNEWKAALPAELEAQVQDLLAGRSAEPRGAAEGVAAGAGDGVDRGARDGAGGDGASRGGATGSGTSRADAAGGTAESNTPEILAMLDAAQQSLVEGHCDDYYKGALSPTFRKTLTGRSIDTLIKGCKNSIANREMLIAALRIVRKLSPRYEYDVTRATYDVSGQGLPFDRFVLEKIEGHWYVAE